MDNYEDVPETIENREQLATSDTINIDEATAEMLDRDDARVPAHAEFWCISLTIVEAEIEMVINLNSALILGRQGASNDGVIFIDLSAYNAHKHGVSREHAIISLQGDHVVIQDNESANYTLLNGKRIEPLKDYPLHPNDIISLGRLKLRFNLIFDPFAF